MTAHMEQFGAESKSVMLQCSISVSACFETPASPAPQHEEGRCDSSLSSASFETAARCLLTMREVCVTSPQSNGTGV
ncbi:hypothetical protein BFN67_02775 [Pseudaminobacter manganicus]|uniref:Uncharacterized protein n=1 Tax=Manganibacter manganicus TaxID=1873176 RepID=A0A1V8RRP5_9HYPH|nr:hypothetical protein BFN67_02775 [Pseudaminobacter manganicus]